MVNKHTVDYHSSPSQLTSRIHPVIILWTPRGFISSETFLNFFLSLYIPSWLRKSFEYMVLRLLANRFIRQKIESLHFYSCSQAKLSSRFLSLPSQAQGNHQFLCVFWRSIFSPAERGRGEEYYGVEKTTKIKPTRVLVTSFDKFYNVCNLYIFGCCFVVT